MTIRIGVGLGFVALVLAAGGCAPRAKINSAHVAEAGTHLVSAPGTLSVVRQSANATKVCTLRTPPGPHGKKGKGHGAGPGAGPGQGPSEMLDTLFFRLCEARANNDISAEQYAASVQTIMKTMSEMASRAPMGPGRRPGMRGPGMGARGPGMGMGPGMGPGMGRRGWNGRGFGPFGGPGPQADGPGGGDGPDSGPDKGDAPKPPKGKPKGR